MSYYGRNDWDDLLYEIEQFLEDHNISELLKIVQTAIERKEDYSS